MVNYSEAFLGPLELMENTKKNIFITGRAGTGKSTLLSHFKTISKKRIAVIAPTGVAAVNVGGQTIHSFFGFKPNITIEKVKAAKNRKMFEALDAIIIDESSMVRADLLDCVDKFLRINRGNTNLPFGGVQMILFGDLYQLPPIVSGDEKAHFSTVYKSPYFFDSMVFENFKFEIIELGEVYRQKDIGFVEILDAIRHNQVTDAQLHKLNERVMADFEPPQGEFFIRLCTLNKMVDEINARALEKIKARTYTFKSASEGDFESEYLPSEKELRLKIGSQVMFLNNDSAKRWVNGTLGKVVNFHLDDENYSVLVELTTKEKVKVRPHTWQLFKPKYDSLKNALGYETIGSFTQYPLRLAWAITIHKSQGKTFEKAIIDLGEGTFATGQAYVALSRCTSIEGMILKKPLERRHIMADGRIARFLDSTREKQKNPSRFDRAEESLLF